MVLARIVEQFTSVRVLVIGDLMLDKYIWGDVSRISPEAPVQVVNVRRESWCPGGAANTAANIGALGGQSVLIGVMGEDAAKQQLTELLTRQRADTRHVIVDTNKPTTQKVRVIARNQQLLRFDYEDREYLSEADERQAIDAMREAIREVQVVVISDYAKGFITSSLITAVEQEAWHERLPVLIDPKPGHNIHYPKATLLTPNSSEVLQLAGMPPEGDVLAAGRMLASQTQSNVLVTRGEQGMSLIRQDGATTHIPTLAREVYDVTGAGDTVIGALALALGTGASLEDAAMIANHAAGIAVSKVGTATVSNAELREAMVE
jgi:D-beta-D-heptose 7-phosphate kinase/D-beta-D-heptose 1-phosphate adenosyltransferase